MTAFMNEEKRALLKAWKTNEKDKFESSLPVSESDLRLLFDYLGEQLGEKNCDDTLALTLNYIRRENLPVENVVKWLEENGGFCDCEVLANVESEFVTNLGEN
jgi:hypothetical protein